MNRHGSLCLLLVLLILLSVGGCGKKGDSASQPASALPSKEDHAKLKEGMTLPEVEAILGKGTDVTDTPVMAKWVQDYRKQAKSVQMFRWGDEKYWTRVGFADGKAVYVGRSEPPPSPGGR